MQKPIFTRRDDFDLPHHACEDGGKAACGCAATRVTVAERDHAQPACGRSVGGGVQPTPPRPRRGVGEPFNAERPSAQRGPQTPAVEWGATPRPPSQEGKSKPTRAKILAGVPAFFEEKRRGSKGLTRSIHSKCQTRRGWCLLGIGLVVLLLPSCAAGGAPEDAPQTQRVWGRTLEACRMHAAKAMKDVTLGVQPNEYKVAALAAERSEPCMVTA